MALLLNAGDTVSRSYSYTQPSPLHSSQPQETGDRTGNLVTSTNFTTSGLYINVATLKSAVDNDSLFVLSLETDIRFVGNSLYLHTDSNNRIVTTLNGTGHVLTTFKLTETDVNNIKSSNNPYFYIYKSDVDFSSTSVELHSGYKIPISSGGENLFPQDSLMGKSSVVQTAFNEIGSSIVFNNGQYALSMNVTTEATTGVFKVCFTYTDGSQDKSQWISYRTPSIVLVSNGTKVVKSISITDYNNYIDIAFSSIMLNLGATALPYEPYNRTTTPIYLGEVPTTRRIKKLVLTGEENWALEYTDNFLLNTSIDNAQPLQLVICTHQQSISTGYETYANFENVRISQTKKLNFRTRTIPHNLSDFKSYLAQQYANGTPVCVWYVLATPETAVVNEPIRKIGDYADTVSVGQAGVQIPTVEGNTVIDVEVELKPSEIEIEYTGWHDANVKAWDGDSWE